MKGIRRRKWDIRGDSDRMEANHPAPSSAQLVDWNIRYFHLLGRFEEIAQGARELGQGCRDF